MVSSIKRGARRKLFPGLNSSSMSPWYTTKTHTTLYSMLAAFIGGQILLTGVFLMRTAPPCDCHCQWRPELEMNKAKAGKCLYRELRQSHLPGLYKGLKWNKHKSFVLSLHKKRYVWALPCICILRYHFRNPFHYVVIIWLNSVADPVRICVTGGGGGGAWFKILAFTFVLRGWWRRIC